MQLVTTGTQDINQLYSADGIYRNRDAAVNDDIAFSGRIFQVQSAGNFSVAQFKNPAASGVTIILDVVTAILYDAADVITVRELDTDLTNSFLNSKSNKIGSATPQAVGFRDTVATQTGNPFFQVGCPLLTSSKIEFDWPLILTEGKGITFTPSTQNIGLNVSFQWREISTP